MVISFKFLQCKRAHPPEIEVVIKRRERRKSLHDYRDYKFVSWDVPWDGTPAVKPMYTDQETGKQFTVPSPNEKDILKMFNFYGIDLEKTYKCPVCDLKGNMRTLLPHLNNDQGVNVFIVEGYTERFGSHGWNFKQIGEWMAKEGY